MKLLLFASLPCSLALLTGLLGCQTSLDDDDDSMADDDSAGDDDSTGDDDSASDDDATADDDTSSDDDSTPAAPGRVVMLSDDLAGESALAYQAFLEKAGLTTFLLSWEDVGESLPVEPQDLVMFLPDLPRDAADYASTWVSHGGRVLGLGVGGARAYGGLEVGLSSADGGQGAVDGMAIDSSALEHPVFAGIEIPGDGIVTVTTSAITDVGIIPSAGVETLAWDRRYPGDYADLCHNDRFWFWGWGSALEGVPEDFTADGAVVFIDLVTWLLEEGE